MVKAIPAVDTAPPPPGSNIYMTDFGAMREIGSSRTGIDQMGVSNRDPLPEMRGDKAALMYRDMRYNDAIVGALLLGIKMVVRTIRWQPQAPADFDEDDQVANDGVKFLQECMDDLTESSFEKFIAESLEAVAYGWEAMEWTMKQRLGPQPWSEDPEATPSSKYDDGRIGWHKISHRDQAGLYRWNIDPHGRVLGMWHRTDIITQPVYIPRWKMVLFHPEEAGGHPEGYSWLRNAIRAWRFKKNHEWLEGVAGERRGIGLPVVRMPMGANVSAGSSDLQKAQSLVRNVRQDSYAGVVLPPPTGAGEENRWGFELMSPTSAADVVFDDTIKRYSSEITVSVLSHFLNLGMSNVGSHALSADERDMWHIAISGLAEMWAETINKELIEPLFEMNLDVFPDRTRWPIVVPTDIAQHDLEKVQAFIGTMVDKGLLNADADDRNRIRDMIGWPKESKEIREQAETSKKIEVEGEGIDHEMKQVALETAKNPPEPQQTNKPPFKGAEDDEMTPIEELVGKPVEQWSSEDWLHYMTAPRGGDE